MIAAFDKKVPCIHESAYIAPNAMVCGDVTVGPDARIMFGAQIIAAGKPITVGARSVVMENAVLRSTVDRALVIGRSCLVGPTAHLVGCTLEEGVFVATGAAIFHGAYLCSGAEVRIRGVVHLKTRLDKDAVVPIGWVAAGDPTRILPPNDHDAIWAAQEPLNFPLTAYGLERSEASVGAVTRRLCERLPKDKLPAEVEDIKGPGYIYARDDTEQKEERR